MLLVWRQRIIQTLILGLFFLVPLIFGPISSETLPLGYERYKVFFLIGISLFLGILLLSDIKKYGKIILSVVLIVVYFFLWNHFWNTSFLTFLLGSEEKKHGILFFLSLAILLIILRSPTSIEFTRKLKNISLFSGAVVSVYAIIQSFGIDFPALLGLPVTWGDGRVFSSLGNPNYLAGYILLLLPILTQQKFKKFFFYWLLFLVTLFLSKSITGIIIGVIYISYILIKTYHPILFSKKYFIPFILIFGIFGIFGSLFFFHFAIQKTLSLESRFSLWQSWGQVQKSSPLGLLIGHGPDSILPTFSRGNILLDSRYFPTGSRLDSFHDVFLDFIYFFGIPMVFFFGIFFVKKWKNLSSQSKEGVLLFLLFFSINIPISIHFLFFIWYLSQEQSVDK